MKHRDPLTGRISTMITFEMQTVWLTQVVYPAMIGGEGPSAMPYKDYNMDEWRWKAGGAVKTMPVNEENLLRMQRRMREIIDDDDGDDLARFASFFFVMDGRAMKETTMVDIATGASPVDELYRRYPQLDWNYMLARENGQLLLDAGMAYNPHDEDQPLVALWDLARVRSSYAAAGMKAPTVHHVNTLA
jgi:hypothetical protein